MSTEDWEQPEAAPKPTDLFDRKRKNDEAKWKVEASLLAVRKLTVPFAEAMAKPLDMLLSDVQVAIEAALDEPEREHWIWLHGRLTDDRAELMSVAQTITETVTDD